MYTIGAVADLVGGKGSPSTSTAKSPEKGEAVSEPTRSAPRYVEFKSAQKLGKRLRGELLPQKQGRTSRQVRREFAYSEGNIGESDGASDGGGHVSPKEKRVTSGDDDVRSVNSPRQRKKRKGGAPGDRIADEADSSKHVQPVKRLKRKKASRSDVVSAVNSETAEELPDSEQKRTKKRGPRKKREHPDTPDKDERTVFVGNLPGTATQKTLRQMFSQYGPIESVRFRSIVPSREGLSRKVAFLTKSLHSTKQTVNAYVVYREREAVRKALALNGSVVLGKHIRVDVVGDAKPQVNESQTVFVGNLPHEVQDEELWAFFAECGDVTAVRLIRDKVTGMGKGFGFVTFKNRDGATLALEMAGRELCGRPIRVTEFSKQAAAKKASQRGTSVQRLRKSKHPGASIEDTDFKGSQAERILKKKKLKKQIREKRQQRLQKEIFQLGGGPSKNAKKKKEARQPNKEGK
ncbi:uncharacterized protein LOC144126125 [Amblyomma americanum]